MANDVVEAGSTEPALQVQCLADVLAGHQAFAIRNGRLESCFGATDNSLAEDLDALRYRLEIRHFADSHLVFAAEQRFISHCNFLLGDFDGLRGVDNIEGVLVGLSDFPTISCPIASVALTLMVWLFRRFS
ncbi:MAG: hypothetical protein ACKVG6_20045 [Alphaproteobacteria bacterium]